MTKADDIRQCLRIHITGRVQGVCFRHYAKIEADQLGVTGFVRNLPDGSVETLICGSKTQLDNMQRWLSHGPEMAHVNDLQINNRILEEIPAAFRIT